MRFRLAPKEEKYFDMFGHMAAHVEEAGLLIRRMFDDFERHAEYVDRIRGVEHACDEITHQIFIKLNQSFITPIDREDIHALAGELDDVVDLIDKVATRVLLYNVPRPTLAAQRIAALVQSGTKTLADAVRGLEQGRKVMEHCQTIHQVENQADQIYHEALGRLFQEERDPITLIKWKEVYEILEKITDKTEDVANVLEAIVLKNQ